MIAGRQSLLAAGLAVVLSGLCFWGSSGTHQVWPLAWLAPLPLLVWSGTPARAFGAGSLAYGIGRAGLWPTFPSLVSPVVLVLHSAVLSILFGATLAVATWIGARGGVAQRVLTFPVTLAAAAALLTRLSPDTAQWSPLYTQTGFLPIVQVAALAGPWAIVFLIGLLPSALAAVVSQPRRGAIAALACVVAVEATAVTFGYTRLRRVPPAGTPSVRVGMAASDPDIRFFRTESREEGLAVVRAYARRVGELADRGAQLVVLPEKMVGLAPSYRGEAETILADAARASGVRLVAGLNLTGDTPRRNIAWVFGPDGRRVLEYDKRLLVPMFEDGYAPGAAPGLVPTRDGMLGVAICRDLLLPSLLRAYGRAGTRVLVAPSWDFTTDAAIQARVPVLRAVEGGYPIVRAAQEGLLVAVDAAGRPLLRRPSWEERETLAVVDVPLGSGRTPYALHGDWFLALDTLALAALVVLARRVRAGASGSHREVPASSGPLRKIDCSGGPSSGIAIWCSARVLR
jgi:apolipoprotein N-acyltransferase